MFRKSIASLLVLAALLCLAAPALADDAPDRLTVMTRNLYVGSSFAHAIAAPTPEKFVEGVSTIWSNVRQSDFRTRASALASEIDSARPDVVGLQEASLWERASGAGPLVPEADYLQILLDELSSRGLSYTAATLSTGFSVVAPAFEDGQPVTLRLTDRDAILVRADLRTLEVSHAESGTFAAKVTIPTAVGAIVVPRTWNLVDGTFRGRPFRLVNTHLEPDFPVVQEAQAQELIAGPYDSTRPLVAIGDFNSAADGNGTGTYALLRAAGLTDAWTGTGGFTCCQAELLDNVMSQLTERIDLVLTGTGFRAMEAKRVGERSKDRIDGLWPSDHAGVVAQLKQDSK